jgi:CubicO group peptidase (beta-lactamase class C family)
MPLPYTTDTPEAVSPFSLEKVETIDSLINTVLDRYRFNGNILVAYKGFPVFTYSKGFRDLYTKDSLDMNTVFQIASVSKGFTAAAILILQQRGLLHINDPVISHVPDFPFPEITIKQMLQHTSGLQNYMYYVDHYWPKDSSLNNQQVLDLLNRHNPKLNFRPGSRHQYNNTGYAMLALVVENVSGKPFYRFAQEEIFETLGMENTFVWNKTSFESTDNKATGFTPAGRRFRKFTHNPLDEVAGDKSVYSTVHDLLKWDQALYTYALLSDSLLQASFEKTKVRRGREYNYGLGWRLKETDNKRVIYHNGLWNGFTSSLTRYVDDNLTIILLNNTNAPVASILRQIYAAIKPELQMSEEIAMEIENQ